MSTYRELIYMTNDLVKNLSDDAVYTEEHIAFLLNKYRMHLLKQKYEKSLFSIPQADTQTICINLQEVNTIPGCSAEGCLDESNVTYARSKTKVPNTLDVYTTDITIAQVENTVYTIVLTTELTEDDAETLNRVLGEGSVHKSDIGKRNVEVYRTTCSSEKDEIFELLTKKYDLDVVRRGKAKTCAEEKVNAIQNYSNINMVSKYRIGYTGYGRYARKSAYATLEGDGYLYLKFISEELRGYNRAYLTGIFEDPDEAYRLSECNDSACAAEGENTGCEPWDNRFPMEEALTVQLLALVVKELIGASWRPKDSTNNANDDLSQLAAFIQRNLRSNIQKQMSGDEL